MVSQLHTGPGHAALQGTADVTSHGDSDGASRDSAPRDAAPRDAAPRGVASHSTADTALHGAADTGPFDVTRLLHEIGRGQKGSRGLDRSTTEALFGAMLDGRVGELEMGGILVAWRVKGETLDELLGGLQAVQLRLAPLPLSAHRSVVSIPSYNGARKSINMTPLLAFLLARRGFQVVVHGVRTDPGRLSTCEVLQAMEPHTGAVVATDAAQVGAIVEGGSPAFVPIDVLAPSLAGLLALRRRLGVRHMGHTLVKLLDPFSARGPDAAVGRRAQQTLRLVSYTHPEFNRLQHEVLEAVGAHALLLRGAQGEAYLAERSTLRIDRICDGRSQPWLDVPGGSGAQLADLRDDGRPEPGPEPEPRAGMEPGAGPGGVVDPHDAQASAGWALDVLAGRREVPRPIRVQCEAIARALA